MWKERNDKISKGLASSIGNNWVLIRRDCHNLCLDNILHNWEACLDGSSLNKSRRERWRLPPVGTLKFNVAVVGRGKPCSTCIGGVLHNHDRTILLSFSKSSVKTPTKPRF